MRLSGEGELRATWRDLHRFLRDVPSEPKRVIFVGWEFNEGYRTYTVFAVGQYDVGNYIILWDIVPCQRTMTLPLVVKSYARPDGYDAMGTLEQLDEISAVVTDSPPPGYVSGLKTLAIIAKARFIEHIQGEALTDWVEEQGEKL